MNTPRQRRLIRWLPALMLTAICSLGGCSKPEPPPTERPPEPRAERPNEQQATQLRDAIRQPINQAAAVDAQVQDAAATQRAAIDAQTDL